MKAINPTLLVLKSYIGNDSFRSGPKEISLDTLVAITAHTVRVTIYFLD
jgi:hypothetical protein